MSEPFTDPTEALRNAERSTGPLPPALADREAYPFAVQTQMPGTEEPVTVRFNDKQAANLYAFLLDTPGNNLHRFVAVLDDRVPYSTELGWREVSYFVL